MGYIQKELIGSGTYAKVYRGIDSETNMDVAIKKIKINQIEGMPSTALREISILKNISHKNIISLLHVVHNEDTLYIIFDFVDFELMKYIKKYGDAHRLIFQLCEGIRFLHSNNIIHRDLKPHNILVTHSGILKIADFGLARAINKLDFAYSSEVVTLWYRAPELLAGSRNYGFEIDIWSLGCIIYEMITLTPLLPGKSKEEQYMLCNNLNLLYVCSVLNKDFQVSDYLILIFSRCLEYNPKKRIKIEDIVKICESNSDSTYDLFFDGKLSKN